MQRAAMTDVSVEARQRMEREWARRLNDGDPAALEPIYDLYSGALYRQALALVGSASDAEDVLQNVFLKLVRRRGGPIRDLRTYLFTAIRHEAFSSLRQRRRESLIEEDEHVLPSHADPLLYGDLEEALRSLPPEQREVVSLKVYEQMTFEEIGQVVKASGNTVASRYRYALKKLRDLLGGNVHA
jgi:RNA polymerase sigma-70 factor, ECF subfamily